MDIVPLNNMNEDEDDPVVSELPVYLSHTLSDQLFIYQYPTKPVSVPCEKEKIIKCCIKPQHQEVSIETALDIQSTNYDPSHGEQIAVNVDGKGSKPQMDKFFQSPMMDKKTLYSSRVLADVGSIAVATIRDEKFILSPVKGVISMYPGFPYLDITDKRAKEEAKEQGDVDVSGGEEEDEAKQITVKFARQESERVKRAREKSFNYLSKKSAEEPWYHTEFFTSETRSAEVERAKFISVPLEDQISSLSLTPDQYMNDLIPSQEDLSWTTPALPCHLISMTALRSLPLSEMVQTVLKEVKVITFGQLCGLLAGTGDTVKLLRSVQQCAVLVQGNWVVRSDIVYPKDTVSEQNGVPAELMIRARDYILCLLSEGKTVDRKLISSTVRLPADELKHILCQFAKYKRNVGWVLCLPTDKDFIEKYPDVVERQNMWWEAKYRQLSETFESKATCASPSKSRSRRRESSMSGGSDLESPVRSRLHSGSSRRRKDSSFSSDAESGTETGRRKKNNSESCSETSNNSRKTKQENLDKCVNNRKKRNSESAQKDGIKQVNGMDSTATSKMKRTKKHDMASPEPMPVHDS